MAGSRLELFQQRDGQVGRLGAGCEREHGWRGEGGKGEEKGRDGGVEGEGFAATVGTISTDIVSFLRKFIDM